MTGLSGIRSDIDRIRAANREPRTPERLQAHFQVERELADRLRGAGPADRARLYGELYAELFARVPDHPQHRLDPARRQAATEAQVAMLRALLSPSAVYLELGCGDARVTQGVAPFVAEAIGVDVTPALVDLATAPPNFRFLWTDGTTLDLPDGCVDLAYSNQLMEHLHTDDAGRQLQEVARVLKPGGQYLCATPNRLTGPHDISVYFGNEPTGFHMREYDHASLDALMRAAGFRRTVVQVNLRGRRVRLPVGPVATVERLLDALPSGVRARLVRLGPVRYLAGVTLVATR